MKKVLAEMVSIWADLDALERDHHLDQLHEPDLGFAWAAYRWAEGDELDDVLDATDLAAGDFVRWVKQLLDLPTRSPTQPDPVGCVTPPGNPPPGSAAGWWRTPASRSSRSPAGHPPRGLPSPP